MYFLYFRFVSKQYNMFVETHRKGEKYTRGRRKPVESLCYRVNLLAGKKIFEIRSQTFISLQQRDRLVLNNFKYFYAANRKRPTAVTRRRT